MGIIKTFKGENRTLRDGFNNIDGIVSVPQFYSQNYYLPITLARTGKNHNLVENPGYE